jgi:spectrin beta
LSGKDHYRKQDVDALLDLMNDEWDALVAASVDKGRKLRQAAAQQAHNKTLDDAKIKLDELNTEVLHDDVGHDMRSCRDLFKKQQLLENEVALWDQKINDLVYAGEEMAQDGHFDADSILKQGQLYRARLARFKGKS